MDTSREIDVDAAPARGGVRMVAVFLAISYAVGAPAVPALLYTVLQAWLVPSSRPA